MGDIVKFTCKECGVIANGVFVGRGFIAINELFICKDCGNVISRTIDEKTDKIIDSQAHCPYCNSMNLEIWNHTCPKCKKHKLQGEFIGDWD